MKSTKITLIILTIFNIIHVKQISEECQNVGLYNNPQTLENSLSQTYFENFNDALKNGVVIGEGGFGKVTVMEFKENDSEDPKEIAVKTIQTEKITRGQKGYKDIFDHEINMMKLLTSHDNFMKFYGCKYERNPNYNLDVAENIESQNIKNKALAKKNGLNSYKPKIYEEKEYLIHLFIEPLDVDLIDGIEDFQNLPKKTRFNLYIKLFKDLKVLHTDFKLTHNDIKPDNIMITNPIETNNYTLKLIDYGMVKKIGTSFRGGTPKYIHPDFFTSPSTPILKPEYDVYAMALTIYLIEMENPDKFALDQKKCYNVGFFIMDYCVGTLRSNILSQMEGEENEEIFKDNNFSSLLPFSGCKTLKCVIIHCTNVDSNSIPSVADIIKQLEVIEKSLGRRIIL